MSECNGHGCHEPARWEQDGRTWCSTHAMEAAIRTGRPMQLLSGPVVVDEPAADDPVAVWDELSAGWESMAIDDHDAVEQLVICALEQGKSQAMELARLRGGAAS